MDYGGPRGLAVSYKRGTPVVHRMAGCNWAGHTHLVPPNEATLFETSHLEMLCPEIPAFILAEVHTTIPRVPLFLVIE